MNKTIKLVIKLIESADGQRVEWVVDGGEKSADAYWSVLDDLKRPTRTVETRLLLETGETVSLPFKEFAHLVPNRTGVLVIFKRGSYTHADGTDVFPYPNNAAIFNANGSLRFQVMVKDPRVHHIECMNDGALPKKFEGMLSVLVAFSENDMPAWAYAVNPEHPDLINAMQWVRY